MACFVTKTSYRLVLLLGASFVNFLFYFSHIFLFYGANVYGVLTPSPPVSLIPDFRVNTGRKPNLFSAPRGANVVLEHSPQVTRVQVSIVSYKSHTEVRTGRVRNNFTRSQPVIITCFLYIQSFHLIPICFIIGICIF